ncbi:family 2 glycosyl transferase [Natrinema saccharevitans]|uniref:Family 2 glycosyl transferase n=1 Tax=Natrinema saccharevitans TaxID=301967 RepID=A0A1S8AVY5_9EURY|nr:glycosyltransferase [Natrinema saccharevitans]OLZ40731.1 family 2 glycosyl transferase [Natrinema saccharevitans]
MANPDASVIVPARNEADRLERSLDSLAGQRYDGRLEVLVAANGEPTVAAARAHPAVDRVLVDGRGAGPGPARNLGANAADGDVLLFTDADTVVPPDWVRRHCRQYLTPEVVGVGGPLRPLEDDPHHRLCFRLLSDWWYRACWPLGFVQQPGPNCSVRRTAFEAVGGFDESLGFLEDTDLSLRLRREGMVVYDPTCPVETSARRQERVGYAGLFLTYLVGYLEYVLPGRSPTREYF